MGLPDLTEEVEAFSILASQTRLDILKVTWAHRYRENEPITYSELKDRVGIDDSGKFNYHLEQLRGRFVKEENGGYVVEMQGIRALYAVFDERFRLVEEDFVPVEGHCPICGGAMQVGYHWDFYVGCSECWEPHLYRTVEPTVLDDREWREAMLAVDRGRRHVLAALLDGACPDCGGKTGFRWYRLRDPAETAPTTMKELKCAVYCTSCSEGYGLTPGELVRAHPRVREYCEAHGIDLDAKPFWCHEWVLTDLTTTVRAEDPWCVEKVANADGCRLAVVFADDGGVETVTHVDLRGGKRAADNRRRSPVAERETDEPAAVASDGGRTGDGGDGH